MLLVVQHGKHCWKLRRILCQCTESEKQQTYPIVYVFANRMQSKKMILFTQFSQSQRA